MSKRRRPLERVSTVRDARLIIIATEDTKAAVTYFTDLISPQYFRSTRIQVKVLQRKDTKSAPQYVLDELQKFKRSYSLSDDDELWLVSDVDRWGDEKLASVAQQVFNQQNLEIAISNPAIEAWFLMHIVDVSDYTDSKLSQLFENNKQTSNRTALELELIDKLGSYSKSNLNTDHFLPHLDHAVAQAQKLDTDANARWPKSFGSHIYKLIKSIQATK